MKGDLMTNIAADESSKIQLEVKASHTTAAAVDSTRSSSFSSVKEDDQGISQSFLVSSRSKDRLAEDHSEEWTKSLAALYTSLASEVSTQLWSIEEDALTLNELSRSSSLVDLVSHVIEEPATLPRTVSAAERLPTEILERVFEELVLDLPSSELTPRNADLVACLHVSRKFNGVATNILYRKVTLPHSFIFSKFFNHISANLELGQLVRRLDLSHFSSVGLGRTKEMNSEIQNLTSQTLLKCLDATPNIQELLLQEHLDQDIDDTVLRKVFYGLPKLRSLDLCACYVGSFVESFPAALAPLAAQSSLQIGIENLSLHECFTIKGSELQLLLSRMPRLRILDLFHTRVTDDALHAIQNTAELTHLNVGHCNNITGPSVSDFIANHPAARKLTYLNISCDVARYRLLRSSDLDTLLPALPSTLRSLNLGGAQLDSTKHLQHLHSVTRHLEELGLGSTNIAMSDIKSFFEPLLPSTSSTEKPIFAPTSTPFPATTDSSSADPPCTLRFLDLTSNPLITQPTLFFSSPPSSRIDATHPAPIPFLLSPSSLPLEVIELSQPVLNDLRRTESSNKRFGWLIRDTGRRGWYVRAKGSVAAGVGREDPAGGRMRGERWWKMGCRSWGMRKCPVVRGEVGGIYGFCMFKK